MITVGCHLYKKKRKKKRHLSVFSGRCRADGELLRSPASFTNPRFAFKDKNKSWASSPQTWAVISLQVGDFNTQETNQTFNVTEVKDANFDGDPSSIQIKTAESVVTVCAHSFSKNSNPAEWLELKICWNRSSVVSLINTPASFPAAHHEGTRTKLLRHHLITLQVGRHTNDHAHLYTHTHTHQGCILSAFMFRDSHHNLNFTRLPT